MEIFFFNADISRQAADPVQPVVEKVNHYTGYNNQYSSCDDVLARFSVHGIKLKNVSIRTYAYKTTGSRTTQKICVWFDRTGGFANVPTAFRSIAAIPATRLHFPC